MPRSIEKTMQAFRDLDAREWEPTYRLDRQIAEARERMGEARWQQLNADWPQTPRETTP